LKKWIELLFSKFFGGKVKLGQYFVPLLIVFSFLLYFLYPLENFDLMTAKDFIVMVTLMLICMIILAMQVK
jgi:hypothetical protein